MSEAIVSIGTHSYGVDYDRRFLWNAVATGALVDDADGSGAGSGARILADDVLLTGRTSATRYALMGDPEVALTDRSIAHPLALSVLRPGYRPAQVALTVPALPNGPVHQDIQLRRLPYAVSGRVLGLTPGPNARFDPVAGATLSIDGPVGPGSERALLLRRPLARDLGPGATLRGRSLTALAAVAAADPAAAGDDHVVLVDGTGVAAGALLRFGSDAAGHWAQVLRTDPDPDRPAPATIAWTTTPLDAPVTPGVPIAHFSAGALTGTTGNPVGPAYAGESVIWLDALPLAGDVLVVREAGQPDRFHDRHLLSDAAGDYRIQGMARMATVTFKVVAAGFVTQSRSFPAATLAGGPIDWRLVP